MKISAVHYGVMVIIMDLSEIQKNFPHLKDITPLAKGGYKTVYRAKSDRHGDVVLKIINSSNDKDEITERIKREVRAAEVIESVHIPQIFESGMLNVGKEELWIIEQWIDGKTLREHMQSGRKYSISEIYNFLEIMLQIIIQAEIKKIVHRDIKPENIIIDTTDKIWLIDFGISRHLDLSSLTNSNIPFAPCTIGYASAEQFRNRKREIDSRTDLFAIGVVAYEMIIGENFYIKDARDAFQVIRKIERDHLPVIKIAGDSQYLIANFIQTIGDNRLSRRPSSAFEAYEILKTIKSTLVF